MRLPSLHSLFLKFLIEECTVGNFQEKLETYHASRAFFYLKTEVSSLWSNFFIMKRILLVDDHENARIAMKLFLEHLGYVCHEAEQGAAALAWLEQGQNVDLIISDNYMPVMTGLDFLLQVKARAPFHSIPFILYSGNITDEIKQKAHQAGVEAVLSKPYNFANFVAIVNKALE
jgi:CheY-like chemotaxis protein